MKIIKIQFFVVLLFFTISNSASANQISQKLQLPGDYHALVIGNADYKDPEKLWKPLETSLSDAQAVATLLEKSYGFKTVNLLQNASRREIINAFLSLQTVVKPHDNVLIYYAGHGHLDNHKLSYWIPIDAIGDDVSTYLHQSVIVAEVKRIASTAQHTLVIADSCFSGDLLRPTRGLQFTPKTHSTELTKQNSDQANQFNYYQQLANNKSVQVLTAGGNEFVDDKYGSSKHSPFTYFLLKSLKDNKQPFISVSQLAETVKPLVSNNAYQEPQNGTLFGAGDEGGEFIFSQAQVASLNLELPDDAATEPKIIPAQISAKKPLENNESQKRPWYKNPWVWVGAVAGGSVIYFSQQDDSSDGYDTVVGQ